MRQVGAERVWERLTKVFRLHDNLRNGALFGRTKAWLGIILHPVLALQETKLGSRVIFRDGEK